MAPKLPPFSEKTHLFKQKFFDIFLFGLTRPGSTNPNPEDCPCPSWDTVYRICFVLKRLSVWMGRLSCPEKVVVEWLVCIQPESKIKLYKSLGGLSNFLSTKIQDSNADPTVLVYPIEQTRTCRSWSVRYPFQADVKLKFTFYKKFQHTLWNV